MARAGKPGPSRNWWRGTLTLVTGALLVYGITGAQTGDTDPNPKQDQGPTGFRARLDTTLRPISTETRQSLRRFIQESMIPWEVEWNTRTGGVRALAAPLGHAVGYQGRGATREEKARNFMADHAAIFWPPDTTRRIPTPEFRLKRDSYRTITLTHYCQGIEVFESGVAVTFKPDGTISRVSARLWMPDVANTQPALTVGTLTEIIMSSGEVSQWTHFAEEPYLLIFPSRPPRLIYAASVKYGPRFLVDAHTGGIISVSWHMNVDPLPPNGRFDSKAFESSSAPRTPSESIPPYDQSGDTLDPDPNMQDLVGRWRAGEIDDTSREYRIMMRELRRIDPSMKPPPKRGKREEEGKGRSHRAQEDFITPCA